MNDESELRRRDLAVRLEWLQESGVALPLDLADIARAWADEQREREVATNVGPSLEERVHSSHDPIALAELLTADGDVRRHAWFVFSVGDQLTGWLERHPDQATALFQALVARGERGEGLASRVVTWLSDHGDHFKVLSCLSMLASSGKKAFDVYLISSAARALRVLANSAGDRDGIHEFWPIWSFVVDAAVTSSGPVQPHENDPLTDSLNAPGGYLAEAFIFKLDQERSDGMFGDDFRKCLDALAAGDRDFHFLARTMLASRLPWLHAIDHEWARDVLINRMSFKISETNSEARALWQGFLWAPRLNPKLLEDLKPAFLQALSRDLNLRSEHNLFYLFGDLLLKAPDKLSSDEIRSAFRDMPVDGLVACARYWRQVLQGASEGASNMWREKIGPLIQEYWPAISMKLTPQTVEALTLLTIQTHEAFDEALETIEKKNLLARLARSGTILRNLVGIGTDRDSGDYYDYARNHPHGTITLIDQSIDFDSLPFERAKLREILNRARTAAASVERTEEYKRLYERSVF